MSFLLHLSHPATVAASNSAGDALDPSTGEIDGRTALAIFPARFEGRKAVEMLESSDCLVSLVSQQDRSVHRRPCGEWFTLPPDVYEYWAEAPGQMSPYARRLAYQGEEFNGRGMRGAAPLVPAGTVVWAGSTSLDAELRLIHAELPVADRTLLRGTVTRRLAAQEPTSSQMPAGVNLAALWDSAEDRYVRLSRPFRAQPGQETVIEWSDPRPGRAHLVAWIRRHADCPTTDDDSLRVELSSASGSGAAPVAEPVAPDLVIPDRGAAYAVWYDLPSGDAEIHARAEGAVMSPVSAELVAGGVHRVQGQMEEAPDAPALDVELEIPDFLRDGELRIELRQLPEGNTLEAREVGEDWSFRFPSMPRSVVEAVLSTQLGTYSGHTDLSSGEDGLLRLVVDPIVISGQVQFGDEGHPAAMTFETIRRQAMETRADAEGWYELVALEPIRSVSIQLESRQDDPGDDADGTGDEQDATVGMQPFVEFFPEAIADDQQRDFEIPDLRFRIEVVDAVTGRPIQEARVVSRNEYHRDPSDRADGSEEPDMAVMQQSITDDSGRVLLPPLRPGRLEVTASAVGYVRMTDPATAQVFEDAEEQMLELRLEPTGETLRVLLLDADGRPAEGASLVLADAAGRILTDSSSDALGEAELSLAVNASLVLVRHAGSAFAIRSWPMEGAVEGEVSWRLERPAGPLSVRMMSPQGDEAVRHARLALWVDEIYLSDRLLHWLTDRRPFADVNGYWGADNLPRRPVAVVGWKSGSEDGALNARLPSMATSLTPPWPERIEITVLD